VGTEESIQPMQQKWTSCDEDEDVVSMAMTAVRRLVERHGMRYHDIGMLQTACEAVSHSLIAQRVSKVI
jgi:3-hydroxy-3-methylglutaryl CoA synthase